MSIFDDAVRGLIRAVSSISNRGETRETGYATRFLSDILSRFIGRPSILSETGGKNIFRKYLSMLPYDNNRRQFYAITWEHNDTDREPELLNALIEYLNGSTDYVLKSPYGYSQEEFRDTDGHRSIYPEIEVGEL